MSNYELINPNIYLVKNEQGYEEALRNWVSIENWPGDISDNLKDEHQEFYGKPNNYPCIAIFTYNYNGIEYIYTYNIYPDEALKLLKTFVAKNKKYLND